MVPKKQAMLLTDGDQNTAFFHQKASQRRRINTINRLQIGNDQWVENEEQVRTLLMDYFKDITHLEGCKTCTKSLI